MKLFSVVINLNRRVERQKSRKSDVIVGCKSDEQLVWRGSYGERYRHQSGFISLQATGISL